MIRNIIFDLGNVLINYRPIDYLKKFNFSDEVNNSLSEKIFFGPEWNECNKGYYEKNTDLLDLLIQRYPEYEKEIRTVLIDDWTEMLTIDEEVDEYLKKLSKKYNIYLFSDLSKQSHEYLKNKYDYYNFIKGGVYSFEVQALKPNKAGYEAILMRYDLDPTECVMVDDRIQNIEKAEEYGIHGVVYRDLKQLKQELKDIISREGPYTESEDEVTEELDYMISKLLKEKTSIKINVMPKDYEGKKKLWRALCNVREANPISKEFLKVEDKFLKKELAKKNVTDVKSIPSIDEQYSAEYTNKIPNTDKICLWQGDLTLLKIDAIVNAANSYGLGCFSPLHYCIDNSIQTFAGIQMRLECNDIMKDLNYNLPVGEAIITDGYNLPAKNVIHTVGPSVVGLVRDREKVLLKNCYKNSLKLAKENDITEIAFPCISTGVFRFPRELAVECAFEAVNEFLNNDAEHTIKKVVFCVYSNEDYKIYDNYIKRLNKVNY